MIIAVIGDKGMFGQDMVSLLRSRGENVAGFNRFNLDLSQSPIQIAEVISRADAIINAIGYTKVDAAQDQPDQANLVNGEYAGKLALAAKNLGAKFIQVSTDYVFYGSSRTPISVDAPTLPANAYGASKLLGEELVSASGSDFQIFRTAWLYGAGGKCFPKSIAKQLLESGGARVVNDQIGQPTWSKDLAEVIYSHIKIPQNERVVHAVASGSASWFEFAEAVASSLSRSATFTIEPLPSRNIATKAHRPSYSVLRNEETNGPIIGDWLDRWKVAAPEVLSSMQKAD
jgi:dTDP-4-dehydrorhamnose reductase